MNTETHLIHTIKGNVPVDSLTYTPRWEIDKTQDGVVLEIRFIEEYHDATGNLVKRNAHINKPNGIEVGAVQGGLF